MQNASGVFFTFSGINNCYFVTIPVLQNTCITGLTATQRIEYCSIKNNAFPIGLKYSSLTISLIGIFLE